MEEHHDKAEGKLRRQCIFCLIHAPERVGISIARLERDAGPQDDDADNGQVKQHLCVGKQFQDTVQREMLHQPYRKQDGHRKPQTRHHLRLRHIGHQHRLRKCKYHELVYRPVFRLHIQQLDIHDSLSAGFQHDHYLHQKGEVLVQRLYKTAKYLAVGPRKADAAQKDEDDDDLRPELCEVTFLFHGCTLMLTAAAANGARLLSCKITAARTAFRMLSYPLRDRCL